MNHSQTFGSRLVHGDLGRVRTCDLKLRKLALYPTELRGHKSFLLYHFELKKANPLPVQTTLIYYNLKSARIEYMDRGLITKLHKNFEDFAHEKDGVEFWYARELQLMLGYDEWRNFTYVIEKAKIACENAKQPINDHFVDVNKMVDLGSGSQREVLDIMLSRYACYLIAQNGDPRKDEIAFAMSYFAVQTRKQEIVEQRLAEIERLQAREKLSLSEKELSGLLFERGVDGQGFARIRSKGDAALFGGYNTQDMKKKLGIPEKRPLADFLPAVTIKAKDLANEITNHKVKTDLTLQGETTITYEHISNNTNVRATLLKSGIHPENLPPSTDTKKIERKLKSENKKFLKSTKPLSE